MRSFSWWSGPAVRPDVYPYPTARAAVELVCVVIFPSPWDSSHFQVVLAPVRTAFTLPELWHNFDEAQAKKILEAQVCRRK